MKNSASMRPDLLLVTTQCIKGGKTHTNRQRNCRMSVSKGFNEPTNSIWLDVYTGIGNTYSQAENALINVSFSDGQEWNGTFAELREKLLD